MAVPYILKRTTVSSRVPTTSDIVSGQLAINLTDQKLFCSNGTGIFEVGSNLNKLNYGNGACNLSYVTSTTSSVAQAAVDSFSASVYRSANYFIQITNGANTIFHTTNISVVHNGSASFLNEYGTLVSPSSLGTFDADYNTGNVRLLFTPATANTVLKISKTNITI